MLGGGVAGSSIAYYLSEKGYDVTVIERNSTVGGLARTCTYSGHPYEFGPHIWFWPGGAEDPVNATIVKLTNNELFHIDRRLFTFVEADQRKYRYPVHYQDIDQMPDREQIHREVKANRDDQLKLIASQLPELGQCKFGDYFTAAIGATLYQKFMANYTWKMWNIPGDELETSMVWADRFHHAYTKKDEKARARPERLRPAQVRGPHARQGHPVPGVSRHTAGTPSGARWSRARPSFAIASCGSRTSTRGPHVLLESGEKHYFADYHTVFCSIDIDELWGENTLPYTGRMMIPLAHSRARARVSRGRRVAALFVVRVPDARDRDEGHHPPRQPGHADPDRGADPAGRVRLFSEEHDRLRAREQPVCRKGVSATVGTGLRDVLPVRRAREEDPEPAVCRPPLGVQVLGHAGNRELRVSEVARVPGGVMAAAARSSGLPEVEGPGVSRLDDVAQARAAAADARRVRPARPARPRPEPAPPASRSASRSAPSPRALAAQRPAPVDPVRRLVRLSSTARPTSTETFESVDRQVALAEALGVS